MVVTKRDAAIRQHHAAIRLWFGEGDPVAIHTLAHASHEIIHRMYRGAGHRSLLFDSDWIKPEYRQRAASRLRQHANFFKHAAHDLNESIEFDPSINERLLHISSWALRQIGEPASLEDNALALWMRIHHPDLFRVTGNEPADIEASLQTLEKVGRREFFELFEVTRHKDWLRRLGDVHRSPSRRR